MAEQTDFKIKGAAQSHAEDTHQDATEKTEEAKREEEAQPDTDDPDALEEGEIPETESQKEMNNLLNRYRWVKCFCDPAEYHGQTHYFKHLDIPDKSEWEAPAGEPYWIWDAAKQTFHDSGLYYPPGVSRPGSSDGKDPNYTGYNPKIHGNYDPTAPYAQYHEKKRAEEAAAQRQEQAHRGIMAPGQQSVDYTTAGVFNRFTGSFQDANKNTDRHNDFNKSGRQMGAFFDVDAAANAHDGRSLKEERRNEKLSKTQIKELREKRREKKEKKRMEWYKS